LRDGGWASRVGVAQISSKKLCVTVSTYERRELVTRDQTDRHPKIMNKPK